MGTLKVYDGSAWQDVASVLDTAAMPHDAVLDTTTSAFSLNSATWADVGIADLTVEAVEGDVLLVWLNCLVGAGAAIVGFDAATMVASSPVNHIGGGGGAGQYGVWYAPIAESHVGGSLSYVVQAGDIEDGTVTLRLRYLQNSASARTLYSSTADPFHWGVVNLKASGGGGGEVPPAVKVYMYDTFK